MSFPDSSSSKNAFSVLMSRKDEHASPRSGRSGTKFVVCPAGCGKRMLERDVNLHLDQCIGSQHESIDAITHEVPASQSGSKGSISGKRKRVLCPACEKAFPTSLINLHLDQCVTRSASSRPFRPSLVKGLGTNNDQPSPLTTCAPDEETLCVSSTAVSPPERDNASTLTMGNEIDSEIDAKGVVQPSFHSDSNHSAINASDGEVSRDTMSKIVSQSPDPHSVFAIMMKQSRTVFASRDKATAATIYLRFHLDESSRVTLCYPMNVETEWTPPNWSASMNLKDRNPKSKLENAAPQTIELTLSSSISSYQEPIRWVRRHSRLSVPVLKSILQKSIRRRKPLPAVRVAMELADKSLGDLLRRLPIIILEDSTLHPDMTFLVWMMMVYSKDYQPSPQSMMRIFQIVYEVAACQWFDSIPTTILTRESEGIASNPDLPFVSLTALSSTLSETIANSSSFNVTTTAIWSMLTRAEYGGMKCDVEMLYHFANIWYHRTTSQIAVPDEISIRVQMGTTPNGSIWSEIPSFIHQKVHEQGKNRVASLYTAGIDCLVLDDICVEGVDFHCSPIIEELLADEELCGLCYDLVILAAPLESDGMHAAIPAPSERRTRLENIFKSAIWNFSSKVNHRRPLLPTTGNDSSSSATSEPNAELWNEWISPRVARFQKSYVEERLSKL
jgi:hypothetical protein